MPRFKFNLDIDPEEFSIPLLSILRNSKRLQPEDRQQVLNYIRNDEYHKIPVNLFPQMYHELLTLSSNRRMRYLVAMEAIYGSLPSEIALDIIHKQGVFAESTTAYTKLWNAPTKSIKGQKIKNPFEKLSAFKELESSPKGKKAVSPRTSKGKGKGMSKSPKGRRDPFEKLKAFEDF